MKIKRREFNQENLRIICELLQPLTPTDTDHPAEYWDNGGAVLRGRQELHLNFLKKSIPLAKDKKDIEGILKKANNNENSVPVYLMSLANRGFPITNFISKFVDEWNRLLDKLVYEINQLE